MTLVRCALLCMTVLALLLLPGDVLTQTALPMINPGFEISTGNDYIVEGWTQVGGGGRRTTTNAASGVASFQAYQSSTTSEYCQAVSLSSVPDDWPSYAVIVSGRVDVGDSGWPSGEILVSWGASGDCRTAPEAKTSVGVLDPDSPEWATVSKSVDLGDALPGFLRIYLRSIDLDTGSVFYDDLAVEVHNPTVVKISAAEAWSASVPAGVAALLLVIALAHLLARRPPPAK